MIIIFYIEALILWFYLDLPHLHNIVIGSEPLVTGLFAIIAFILLAFKYRDEKLIRELSLKKANSELYENVAKIFLSIRDRANTPLQRQKIITGLLKTKFPQEKLLPELEKSINELASMNELLGRFVPKFDYKIMSEEETDHYLKKVENHKKV